MDRRERRENGRGGRGKERRKIERKREKLGDRVDLRYRGERMHGRRERIGESGER